MSKQNCVFIDASDRYPRFTIDAPEKPEADKAFLEKLDNAIQTVYNTDELNSLSVVFEKYNGVFTVRCQIISAGEAEQLEGQLTPIAAF